MTIERLRELWDDDISGPWRSEALAEDEPPPLPIWLDNDAGDLWQVSVADAAMVLSALPALVAVAEAASEELRRLPPDYMPRLREALAALEKLP